MENIFKSWLNPVYLSEKKISRIKEKFQKNTPFPHYIFEEFLLPKKAQELRTALITCSFAEKDADLFFMAQTEDLNTTTEPIIASFIAFLKSKELHQFIATITDCPLAPTVDVAGSVYPMTGYLLPHDDQLEGRAVAYVLNLSQRFTKKDGGALELFTTTKNQPTEVIKSYPPQWNSFVIFAVSPKSFHQVTEVNTNNPRLSINGWFHWRDTKNLNGMR